jgi:hypothetical protein
MFTLSNPMDGMSRKLFDATCVMHKKATVESPPHRESGHCGLTR